MKNIKYLFLLLLTISLGACDYLRSPDDTEIVSKGFITFPNLILTGDSFIQLSEGDDYAESGFSASLGTADITDDVVVSGNVDPSKAGLYVVSYSIETVNELDETQTVTAVRSILVQSSDVDDVDLAGQYQGSGFGSQIATVVKIGRGAYTIDKLLASGNNIGVTFYHVGGNILSIPDQPGPFGNVNTTSPNTSAMITDNGFEWTAFIGCCGNFGPITFVKL